MAVQDAYDAESVVLSYLLRNAEIRRKFIDKVSESDFEDERNKKIFRVLILLVQNQSFIDQDTINEGLSGEDSYTRMFASLLFASSEWQPFTDELFTQFRDEAVRYRLKQLQKYLTKKLKSTESTEVILNATTGMLDRVEGNTLLNIPSAGDSIESAKAQLDTWRDREVRLDTGIPEVDRFLFLNQLFGLIYIGGDPSAGKTTLLTQILRANAENGVPVLLFSLEMSREQVFRKMAMADPRMENAELNSRTIQDENFLNIYKKCLDSLQDLPIFVVDNVFNINVIYNMARKMSITNRIELTAVDYMQLCEVADPRAQEYQVISQSSKILKRLSKPATGYPLQTVIGVSQYSREGKKDKRGGKPPKNDALKGSSQLEQDADTIFHLMTEETEVAVIENFNENLPAPLSPIKLFCGKQREGRNGWAIKLLFDKAKQQMLSQSMTRTGGYISSNDEEANRLFEL